MALLPSGYIYSTRGNSGSAVEKIGGVIIGISSATNTGVGQPITTGFLVKDQAIVRGRNRPIKKTSAGAYNATDAKSGGTFAYDQTRSDWTVLRMGTTLNGSASTVHLFTGSAPFMAQRNIKQKALGAKVNTAVRAGYLTRTGVANQRNPWSTQPGALTGQFVAVTGNTTPADDQAIYVTYMAVPGELVYIQDGKTVKTDDYKARTGN
jgi:hypothetical protein